MRTRIPADHPSQWIGDCCPVHYVQCQWCEATLVQRNPRHLYCSDYCSHRMKQARRRSRECCTPENQTWTWGAFMRMSAKFSYCCAYCGAKPDRLDPDHVVPLSRGGRNTLANLLPACLFCNSDKRDLPLAAWNADRARRGLLPRSVDWMAGDHRYDHLTSVLASA